MSELLKLIKNLLGQGFASKADKAKVKSLFKELGEDERETVGEDAEKVEKLPEEKEGQEGGDDLEKMLKNIVNLATDQKFEQVKSNVKEWMEEQKELLQKQSGVYQKDVKAGRKALNIYARSLCKAVLGNDIAKIKELTTDDQASPYGGYIVDSELSAEIRLLETEYGVARREMLSMQLSKNSYKANELVTDAVVYWVDEAGSISSSQVVLGQHTLELKKIAVVIAFTSELLEDEEIDLVSFVTTRVAELASEKEDEAFFNGDGSSPYGSFTGLLKSTYVNTVTMTGTTFASIDADDLLDMIDNTPTGALRNAKFYMHKSVMSYIRKLKDTYGQYVFQTPSEKGPGTIWGYPVVFVEVMPTSGETAANTAFVIFGDLKKGCIFGYKGAIKAKRFDAGTIRNVAGNADINLITTDREAIRFTERVGYVQVIQNLKKPITVLKTAAVSA